MTPKQIVPEAPACAKVITLDRGKSQRRCKNAAVRDGYCGRHSPKRPERTLEQATEMLVHNVREVCRMYGNGLGLRALRGALANWDKAKAKASE